MSNMLNDTCPDIAKEWHPTKNGTPTADKVSAGSHKKAWWLGACGHEWEGVIRNRVNRKSGCHYCAGKKVLVGFNDLASLKPEVAKEWHPALNKTTPEDYTSRSNMKVWWECVNGHVWEAPISYRTGKRGGGCSYCVNQKNLEGFNVLGTLNPNLAVEWNTEKSKIFKPEKEIAETIKKLEPNLTVKTNAKTVIKPYELDVYIPEKKIAIEYNGLYWHSEHMGKDKNYHYSKWLSCKEQGIQLIQIWEDDWSRSPELVKSMIAHKLGLSTKQNLYARNTKVQKITQTEADTFLNKHHIQGSVSSRLAYGLFFKSELIAVMLFKTEANSNGETLNLLRYATSEKVVGGFTKLLKFAEQQNPEVKNIITFSDNTISDGGLYLNNGFVEDGIVKPDYMYIVNGVRVHKFNYRLKRFKTDPNLKWVEGYTETQLARLNNIPRIWDAGKVRYLKQINR
jgi:very-short-patch-repair endonuclease